MTIRFNLSAELTINDLELQELECVHNHGHEDHGDKHCHHHGDDNSLGSLKGSASLKFDAGLDVDATPDEMRACYDMITAIGTKFAEVSSKTREFSEHVVEKVNHTTSKKSETKSDEDEEKKDSSSFEIEVKAELKKATSIIAEEESKSEPEIEQVDWARLKLDSVARTLRRAQREDIELNSEILENYRKLRCRLANLNSKC